jgi:hypothetical protein
MKLSRCTGICWSSIAASAFAAVVDGRHDEPWPKGCFPDSQEGVDVGLGQGVGRVVELALDGHVLPGGTVDRDQVDPVVPAAGPVEHQAARTCPPSRSTVAEKYS